MVPTSAWGGALFARREIEVAREWALAGGIALHRNFALVDLMVGGRRRHGQLRLQEPPHEEDKHG